MSYSKMTWTVEKLPGGMLLSYGDGNRPEIVLDYAKVIISLEKFLGIYDYASDHAKDKETRNEKKDSAAPDEGA